MIKLTKEIINQSRSSRGGYSRKQLAAIGVDWPPKKGWKKRVIGSMISFDNYKILTGNELSTSGKIPLD